MEIYQGVIIEESLAPPSLKLRRASDKAVLSRVKIVSTKVEPITEKHKTPWLKQWTLHTVEVPKAQAKEVAEALSHAIDTSHTCWYADFKTETHHYIIYPHKVFFIDRTKKAEYDAATPARHDEHGESGGAYGVALGIPEYQVDFSPEVKGWER